jgi:hypothetical protein
MEGQASASPPAGGRLPPLNHELGRGGEGRDPVDPGPEQASLPPEPVNPGVVEAASGEGDGGSNKRGGTSTSKIWWIAEVPRQVKALTKKNLILARRNTTSTAVRTCSSLIFMLMIFLVNEGLKGRYSTLAYFQDLKDGSTERTEVPGIPECKTKRGYDSCITFAYVPAPWDEYTPAADYEMMGSFAAAVKLQMLGACQTTSGEQCDGLSCISAGTTPFHPCAKCCEMYRVHRVVRNIMKNNGTSAGKTGPSPIPADKVLGFTSDTALDAYLLRNPEFIQGGLIFSSPHVNSTTFMVQHNSTASQSRGAWRQPVMEETIPMLVTRK